MAEKRRQVNAIQSVARAILNGNYDRKEQLRAARQTKNVWGPMSDSVALDITQISG